MLSSPKTRHGAEETRNALLLAALSLFAANGVGATSINRITQAAGCRNSSALHYHFGSKDGLLDQLVGFIQSWFDERRQEALQSLEKRRVAGGQIDSAEVLRLFVMPYVDLIESEPWGLDAVRLLSHLEFEQEQSSWNALQRWSAVTAKRFLRLLSVRAGAKASFEYQLRLLFFIDSVIHGFATHKHLKASFFGDLQPSRVRELGEIYVQCGMLLLGAAKPAAA